MPARAARSATRTSASIRPAVAALARRRHRRRRAAVARRHVPSGGPRHLRRGDLHVSRSGADPGEDPRLRRDRQRHARPRLRPHLARPRHGVRHRRHAARPIRRASPRRCGSPRSCAATKWPHEPDRRSAAAPRRHRPARHRRPRNPSARISFSTSTSPRASPAPPAILTGTTVDRGRPRPGRPDPRAACRRRAPRRRHRARRALHRGA